MLATWIASRRLFCRAGTSGFGAGERYWALVAAGERVLLPAVREAAADELVIADGFSCRERSGSKPAAPSISLVLEQALGPVWR